MPFLSILSMPNMSDSDCCFNGRQYKWVFLDILPASYRRQFYLLTQNRNLRTGYFQVLFCSLKVWMRKEDNSAGPGWSPCLGPTVSLPSEMQQTIFNRSPVHRTSSVEYSTGLRLVPVAQCTDLEALPALVKAPGSSTGASSLKNFSCNCLLSPLNLFLLKLECINENPQDFIGHFSSPRLWGNRNGWCKLESPLSSISKFFLLVSFGNVCSTELFPFPCLALVNSTQSISLSKKIPHALWTPTSPLATTCLLSIPMDLPILDISHTCHLAICILLCLASFT